MKRLNDNSAVQLARAILRDRHARRTMGFRIVMGILVAIVLGTWPLAGWLASSPWLFLAYWLGVTVATVFVLLLAIYDMSRVPQEELERMQEEADDVDEG